MENYLKGSEECGIKVGDKVEIIRSAKSFEDGWDNDWVEEMDQYVGGIFEVTSEDDGTGFYLQSPDGDSYYGFPYFVLEKR